jgi:hypothetical protein
VALALLVVFGLEPAAAQGGPCAQSLQNRADVAPPSSTVDVPACTYHETVYIGHGVTLDGHGQAVIDGDNVRDRWFWIGASDVTIRGFSMRNAATVSQEGAIGTQAGIRNIVIDHNDLGSTANGEQVGIGETIDSKVTNNQIHGGGQLGIGTWRNTNLTISGNHVYGNNTAGVDPEWAAGGIKAVQDNGLVISGNEVDHNNGPGIWVDILATGVVISGNNVHDQQYNPIFFETSSNGDIYANTVSSSPTGPLNWGCIISASSANVRIHDNVCQDTSFLRAQLDNRTDVPAGAGQNNVLQNNRLVRPNPPQATSWWQWDPNGPLQPGKNGNVDTGNVILQSLNAPTPAPTSTPTTTGVCDVKVRINGNESAWKPCF